MAHFESRLIGNYQALVLEFDFITLSRLSPFYKIIFCSLGDLCAVAIADLCGRLKKRDVLCVGFVTDSNL